MRSFPAQHADLWPLGCFESFFSWESWPRPTHLFTVIGRISHPKVAKVHTNSQARWLIAQINRWRERDKSIYINQWIFVNSREPVRLNKWTPFRFYGGGTQGPHRTEAYGAHEITNLCEIQPFRDSWWKNTETQQAMVVALLNINEINVSQLVNAEFLKHQQYQQQWRLMSFSFSFLNSLVFF